MRENTMLYSQERHAKGKLCKKIRKCRWKLLNWPCLAANFTYSIESNYIWRLSYLNFIFRKCAESIKMCISEKYSFQHLSHNTTLIQAFRQTKNYDVCSWIQDRSSAHPWSWRHQTSRSNSLKHLYNSFIYPYKTDSCLNSLLPVGTPSLDTPWFYRYGLFHNFKNIRCYAMSEVSLKRFYFALFHDRNGRWSVFKFKLFILCNQFFISLQFRKPDENVIMNYAL